MINNNRIWWHQQRMKTLWDLIKFHTATFKDLKENDLVIIQETKKEITKFV